MRLQKGHHERGWWTFAPYCTQSLLSYPSWSRAVRLFVHISEGPETMFFVFRGYRYLVWRGRGGGVYANVSSVRLRRRDTQTGMKHEHGCPSRQKNRLVREGRADFICARKDQTKRDINGYFEPSQAAILPRRSQGATVRRLPASAITGYSLSTLKNGNARCNGIPGIPSLANNHTSLLRTSGSERPQPTTLLNPFGGRPHFGTLSPTGTVCINSVP